MKTLFIIFSIIILQGLPCHAAQDEIKTLTNKGNESFTRGEFDRAATLYDKALKIEAKNPTILYNRANVLFQQEKFTEAASKYKEALKASPSRRLIINIYFNAGNTALKLAKLQTKEKQGLYELQKAISYYDTSFNMYRKSLAQARALSIAEGRDVNSAGLSAKKNWALARELWTATLDKIKTIQKKNMSLEDGIRGLLTAQSNLLPTLEGIFLNSLTDDALKFNLKRLAEYQLDYKEEIATLRSLAAKQEEETENKISNLKTSTPAVKQGKATPPAKDIKSPESAELEQQLKTAQEIKKAVSQAAALDEWIVDNLKKNQAMEAWNNAHKMVDLLEDLSSFLEGNDPVLKSYHNGISQLKATNNLLSQAKNLAKIKDNDNAAIARQRRLTLAGAKTDSASIALTKINFYLAKIKANQIKESTKEHTAPTTLPQAAGSASTAPKEKPAVAPPENSARKALQTAMESTKAAYLEELETRNKKLAGDLKEMKSSITDEKDISLSEAIAHYNSSFSWYQNLGRPVSQIASVLLKDTGSAEDILNTLLETNGSKDKSTSASNADRQLAAPNEEQMNILLFQLSLIEKSLKDAKETGNTGQIQSLEKALAKSSKELKSSWQKGKNLRDNLPKKGADQALLANLNDIHLALIRSLLIFSPDMAINLYFERSAELQQHLLDLLPAREEITSTINKRYNRAISEAAGLNSLLVSFLDSRQKSINAMTAKEKQATYQTSLKERKKAVPLIQRLIDTGRAAASLLDAKKFQEAEILFKDMPGSLQKSRLAFSEQPKEAEKALTISIELQKKLEEQSRAANAATTIEGESKKIIHYVTANQDDINTLSDKCILLLQNMIGMADVPTQGQDPTVKGNTPKKMDSKKLNKAIDKVKEAQGKMVQNSAFLKAGEFNNTFNKHQEIIDLLQEALDLLKNKDQKKEDKNKNKKDDKKKSAKQQKKNNQTKNQKKPHQQNGAGQGKPQPKKPLEMSSQEARELLKQLNKQDEKQQHQAIPGKGHNQINTPRPW